MTPNRLALLLGVAPLMIAGAVSAQTPPPLTPAERAALRDATLACRADIGRLCGDVPRGEGRILACLQQQAARASAPCQQKLDAAQALLTRANGG